MAEIPCSGVNNWMLCARSWFQVQHIVTFLRYAGTSTIYSINDLFIFLSVFLI